MDNQGQLHDDVRDLFGGVEEFGFDGVPHDYAPMAQHPGLVEKVGKSGGSSEFWATMGVQSVIGEEW